MPSDRAHRHRLELILTPDEWQQLRANAYAREISCAEMVRRAVKHLITADPVEAVMPPRKWRMNRACV